METNMWLKKHWKLVVTVSIKVIAVEVKIAPFQGEIDTCKIYTWLSSNVHSFTFFAPTGVLDMLEKIIHRFLWVGSEEKSKIQWISWAKVIAGKELEVWGLALSMLLTF